MRKLIKSINRNRQFLQFLLDDWNTLLPCCTINGQSWRNWPLTVDHHYSWHHFFLSCKLFFILLCIPMCVFMCCSLKARHHMGQGCWYTVSKVKQARPLHCLRLTPSVQRPKTRSVLVSLSNSKSLSVAGLVCYAQLIQHAGTKLTSESWMDHYSDKQRLDCPQTLDHL